MRLRFRQTVFLFPLFLLVTRTAWSELVIDKNLPAGNILVTAVTNDTVYLQNEMRDTSGWWFYWAFRVTGADGRTLTFRFTNGDPIGTRGPVVSYDQGANWSYVASGTWTVNRFTHIFPADPRSNEVWFAMAMNYTQRDWDAFLARHRDRGAFIETNTLCTSRKGRAVECARFGCIDSEPRYRIWLSARHHACEMMASYVLEGILDAVLSDTELGAWLRGNVEFMVVPFVDKDGVEDGDQGKSRIPHDHNRDYNATCLYSETQAIKTKVPFWGGGKLIAALDIHCPYIRGTYNEWLYQVYTENAANARAQALFGRLLEHVQRGGMNYQQANDLPFNQSWNTSANYSAGISFKYWLLTAVPDIRLCTTYEVPFATANGKIVTRESCRKFGEDTAMAFRRFLETPSDDLWFRPVDGYAWNNTNNWLSGADSPVWRTPTLMDRISLSSSRISSSNGMAVVIGPGVEAECERFQLGERPYGYTVNARITEGTLCSGGSGGTEAFDAVVGGKGRGFLSLEKGEFTAGRCVLGDDTSGRGIVSNAGGIMTMNQTCSVGRDGSGTLLLKGGTLRFPTITTDVNLFVRLHSGGCGTIRGWGKIIGKTSDNTNVRIMNNGTVVADGDGLERDLDLHEIVSTTNTVANGMDGTNGWYAVNKGRLLYPRAWINSAVISRNQGEPPFKTVLEMVNSVRISLTGAQTPTFLRAGLCAPDRSDIPAGLPVGHCIGVWCVGLYSNNTTENATANFDTVTLSIRYDGACVKEGEYVQLFRFQSGAWVKAGEKKADEIPLIATETSLLRLTDGDYNIGWFVLIVQKGMGLSMACR